MKNKMLDIRNDNKWDQLLKYINKKLKPVKTAKKDRGEVFTPLVLVEKMLDQFNDIPEEIWNNPDLKWLDPANGIGNFPIMIYKRLMDGLKEVPGYTDKNVRSNHIITKMLYMIEIDPTNVSISKQIFGEDANILLCDFNDFNTSPDCMFSDNGVPTKINFDIIIGNPPFNSYQKAIGKRGGGSSLWPTFVKKSLELLQPNKYLIFLHPSGWRKPESKNSKYKGLFKLMTTNNTMLQLNIYNTKSGSKFFSGTGTRFDFYVIQKKQNTGIKTIIVDEKKNKVKKNLLQWQWLPNFNYDLIQKIIINRTDIPPTNKLHDHDFIYFNRTAYGSDRSIEHTSNTEDDVFKYKLIHSTPKKGIRYMYSSRNDKGFFRIPKIIFGESGIYNSVIDMDGKYGMTQGAMAIKINSLRQGENIKKCIDSKFFETEILEPCSFGNFRIDWRMFCYFKKDFYKIILKEEKKIKKTKPDTLSPRSAPVSDVLSRRKIPIPRTTVKKRTRKKKVSICKNRKKNRDPICEDVDKCKWVKKSGCFEKGLEGGSINSKRSIKTPKTRRINLTNKK